MLWFFSKQNKDIENFYSKVYNKYGNSDYNGNIK